MGRKTFTSLQGRLRASALLSRQSAPSMMAIRSLPCLMHRAPIPRWPRRSPSPVWSKPALFRWIRLLPLLSSNLLGTVKIRKNGLNCGPAYSRTMVSCWKAMPRPSKLRGRANPWTACTKTKASSPENHRDGGSLSEHHQSFPLCGEGTDFLCHSGASLPCKIG